MLSESNGWKNNPVFSRVAGKPIKWFRNNKGVLVVKDEGALEEFRECLKIAAEENMGMLVMGIVTSLRSKGDDEKREAWLRAIGKAGALYNNVAWEVANEAWHPSSQINRTSFLNRMYGVLKNVTGGQWVSQDQNIGAKKAKWAYRYDSAWKSDAPDFHPWRFPEPPSRADVQEIIARNDGQFVLLSEGISWTADPADVEIFGRLVTPSKNIAQASMDACEPPRCGYVFHSIEGLFAEGRFSWMAQR